MKTRCMTSAAVLAVLTAVIAQPTFGATLCPVRNGERIAVYAGAERLEGGGAFLVENISRTVDSFLSFCLEYNEFIDVADPDTLGLGTGSPVYTVQLSTGAVKGGLSGQTTPTSNFDPLSPVTAWLYSQRLDGALPSSIDLDGPGGAAPVSWDDKDFQGVVWAIEGEWLEKGDGGYTPRPLSDGAKALLGLGEMNALSQDLYGVRVMNLIDEDGKHKQSLLVRCPVPEPSTIAVWGLLGICGMMIVRRRNK